MDGSFPNETLHVPFGLMVDELESYKDFNPSSGMLSATANVAKATQNFPKLPKFAKIYPKTISLRNFEMPPKIEILMFLKKKNLYLKKKH
jgi:hypothetical protein